MPETIKKCLSCGGELKVNQKTGIPTCIFCGREYKSGVDDFSYELQEIVHRRQMREFIQAEELSRELLRKQPESSEVYWQMLLVSFGVVYVQEECGAKPTFFSYSYNDKDLIINNKNYKNAIKFAPSLQDRKYYEDHAKELDVLLKEFFRLVSKESCYDIFISFRQKVTATVGGEERQIETDDYKKAQEIYNYFSKKYKVFFSPVSIGQDTGIEGEKYEPRILKALQTSQAMILLGSRTEYLESQWVQNEWKRYQYFISKGKKSKNSLILGYEKNMPALPFALKEIQLPSFDWYKSSYLKELEGKLSFVKSSKRPKSFSKVTEPEPKTETDGIEYLHKKPHKNRRKRLLVILSSLAAVFVAVAIGVVVGLTVHTNKTINLSSPSSLRISGGEVVWDSVENADSYVVMVNDTEIPVSANNYSLGSSYEAGIYEIAVKATGSAENIIESVYSDAISVVKPNTPSDILLEEGVLSWGTVTGYSTYKIEVNGNVIATVSDNEYSLLENYDKISAGDNAIGVIVAGDNVSTVNSDCSEKISFTKLSIPLNVSISEDTLSWQNVSGAIGYLINVGGSETKSITIGANINTYYLLGKLQKGTYQISVQALGDNNSVLNSDLSSSCAYTLSETIISVSTRDELIAVGSDLSAKYVLQNDIDLSGEDWVPIGTISSRFEGVFIGNGYSISGLTLTSTDTKGAGLFGVIGESGKVSDLNLDVYISGGTTGYVGAVAGVNYGTVFDVTVTGTVGISNSGDNVGGLFGRSYGSIYNCTNKAEVNGGTNVGGIAGNFEFNNANMIFSGCSNEGSINGSTRVGGIVGYLRVARLVYIDSLSNSGSVTASAQYAGGIVGYVEGISGQTGNFESCVNSGDITASNYVGGCFGYVGSYINITTSNPTDTSLECSNTGTVTATSGSNKGNIKGN